MLGEKVGDSKGKVVSRRVLPNPGGGPKFETTFQAAGTTLGVAEEEWGTYVAEVRPDGTLFGEGNGVVMSKEGDVATWTGQGVGIIKGDGGASYRGAIYFQSSSQKWARLNSVAVVFEYDVDAQGNTTSKLTEWK